MPILICMILAIWLGIKVLEDEANKKRLSSNRPPEKLQEELYLIYKYYLEYANDPENHPEPIGDAYESARTDIFNSGYRPTHIDYMFEMKDHPLRIRDYEDSQKIPFIWPEQANIIILTERKDEDASAKLFLSWVRGSLEITKKADEKCWSLMDREYTKYVKADSYIDQEAWDAYCNGISAKLEELCPGLEELMRKSWRKRHEESLKERG